MSKLEKINKRAGYFLFPGLVLAQLIISFYMFSIGSIYVLFPLLTGGIILPFAIASGVSMLSREKSPKKISIGITTSIILLIITPILFPLFFDQEFIYISFLGVTLGIAYWLSRKWFEIHLIVFNSLSTLILIFLIVSTILGSI